MYQHPGVYIEEIPSGVLAIEAASTSIAAFVGQTKRGALNEPEFIATVGEFAQKFGALINPQGGIYDLGDQPDYFGHAVNAFFSNGGKKAYIVPVAAADGQAAIAAITDPLDNTQAFYFEGSSAGSWANDLVVQLAQIDPGDAAKGFNLDFGVVIDGEFTPLESHPDVRTDPNSGQYFVPAVNGASLLARVEHKPILGATGGGETEAQVSGPLLDLDLAALATLDLDLTVNAASPVTVTFDGSATSLAQLADFIQAEVRNGAATGSGREGFVAQVTRDGRLLFISGTRGSGSKVEATGGTARTALKLDPTVYLGTQVSSVDSTAIDGTTLDVVIGTGSPVTVTFGASVNDLAAAAAEIQAVMASGFVAEVTADSRLRLRVTDGGSSSAVSVTGGDARQLLGLLAGETDTQRPSVLDYPAILDSTTKVAQSPFMGGTDNGAPGKSDYVAAFETLRDYRDASIIILPGQAWVSDGNEIIDEAVSHADFMKNRMVIVDPPDPKGAGTPLRTSADAIGMGFPTSTYTALYYPWLEVANPHYNPDTAANKPKTFPVPPSGAAAGLWARIDGSRGVWKAPAGLEATVRGSKGPNVLVGNEIQDNLNQWGVNCIRAIIGPSVIWGARTLATKVKPDHRYIPVRRTSILIGESLYNALQAVVFEPNDHKLWASLRASVTNFMDGLHRAGAFQGEKASEAYFVRCGLGSTMTQGDIDAGIVRVVVGFAPLKPAEFVVVQIQQIVGQSPS